MATVSYRNSNEISSQMQKYSISAITMLMDGYLLLFSFLI